MSFEKYVCWNPEELSRVIHTEAEATQENLFLAIHTDSKIKVSISGSKAKNITYQDFLEDFLEGEHGNNVQTVIEGESGSGKSHLVQWMRFNIPQNEKRIVITIPKTQNNLYSVLKKLVAHLPNEEQIKYNEKLQRTENGLKNDTERINEFLSSLARTIEKDISQGINKEEEEYLIPLLPKLFDDPYFRDKFFNNHEIINNIISLIFSNSAINRNSENRQEFKQQHLPLNAREATNASQSTQEVLDVLQEEDLLKISLELINRNLDKAITRTLSFSPDDLIELMSDIRSYFYKQNQELILLIEDFAQLQGVDTALLQVLTVEGSGELCQIRWAMAVTTGYFEKLEDTVRTRMTFKVNMDAPKDSDRYILKLGSKYLNAIRLGNKNIESWYESYRNNPIKITNYCDSCEHKKVCHNTFGAIDNIGLYPFNKTALLQMAKKADTQKREIFRPRIFINKVLKRNLNKEMVQVLKNGQYPPKDLLDDFKVKNWESEELLKSKQLDSKNHDRRHTLMEIWADSDKIVNLKEDLHKAFSLPLLNNIPEENPKELVVDEDSKPIDSQYNHKKEDDNIINLDNWGSGESLKHSTASKLRPLIYNSIVNHINWDFLSIAKSISNFKQANIYFEGQGTRRPTSGFVLEIEQNLESAILFKAMLKIDKEKKIIDIEAFADIQEQVKKWAEYVVAKIEKYYQPKENWNPAKASIELLILSSLASANKPTIDSLLSKNTNYSDMASFKFNSLLKILSDEARQNVLIDTFQKTYTGRKGGSKTTSFIDVQKVLPIIKELKSNSWRLKQEPSQEPIKEFKDVASLYKKWQDGFDDALQDELMERYKWLDELTNKIEIEEIGVKFKNQIKKLRELTENLGISGYKSISLDNALKCNLNKAKKAMEITKKLQEQTSIEIFNDFFPSRKEDAKAFIQVVKYYEDMLKNIDNNLRSKSNELERQIGLSAINLEISDLMSKIDKSFKKLIKKDDNAS
ncbi:COG0419: ATPase involved in DNA repair [hydrothermal vent metagenome]|uniref:COG0419: ATPase involved in DNA repair n=1 Tax=hydrothermal vent metagenome TaxID=652676 RepID=A0A1W1CI91_9ZZZZ